MEEEKETKAPKRYFWLKLQDDFFESKRIKKLRKIAGGDTYTIIYLKMQLKAIKTDGILEFTGLEEDFANELALDIDEDVENVKITINYLLQTGLLEQLNDYEFSLPYVPLMTGSETAVAQRVRDYRAKKKSQLLQCNTDVTQVKQLCNGEIEKEKEIEIDKEKYNKKKTFTKPTIEEIQDYINEKSYEYVDAEEFYYFYDAKGWLVGKDKMKDWKSSVAGWNARNKNKSKENTGKYQQKEQVVYKYTNQFQTEKKASSPKDYGLKYDIDEVKVLAQKKKDNGDPRPLDEIEESIFWGHEDGE